MDKLNLKNILIAFIIASMAMLGSACSDDKDYANSLVLVTTNQSFALLLMDVDEKVENETAAVENLIKKHNPQVTILDNMKWNYTQGIDPVIQIAYNNSHSGQARQGYFSTEKNNGSAKEGVGFFVTKTFSGTRKITLEHGLTLHAMGYELGNGKVVTILNCSLDKKSTDMALKQAKALADYSSKIDAYTLIKVTVTNNQNEVANILKGVYKQACDVNNLSTDGKTQYVFAPQGDLWGVKYAANVKDNNVSTSNGLLLRIGLTE